MPPRHENRWPILARFGDLDAIVEAAKTRPPYQSGHSHRVEPSGDADPLTRQLKFSLNWNDFNPVRLVQLSPGERQ